MTQAEAELGLCQDVVSVRDVWERLYALGVRERAVTGGGNFAALRFAAVKFLPSGAFEFAHNLPDASGAVLAVIVPMLDIDGRTHDLVALDLETMRAARWRRSLSILGMHRLYGPRIEPLAVYQTPLEWLRAGRDGIVIADFPAATKLLCGGEPLAVDDAAFGRELHAKLRLGPPRILVREQRRVA